jgi:tetratricopeptide (TPR) repeat protein
MVGQTARVKLSEVSVAETSLPKKISGKLVNIRVSPNSYFVAFFLATFVTAFLVYLELDLAALILFLVSWVTIPLLAWTDRIVFDGQSVFRIGFIPSLWAGFSGKPRRIKVRNIEQIETQALRALRRGGNVFYRYRTSVQGKGLKFVFASGGEDYRQMVGNLFHSVKEDVLDNRSLELRDYLKDQKDVLMKAEFAKIPSMEVLESSTNEFQSEDRNFRSKPVLRNSDETEIEKSEDLRQLANELRVTGNLLQSLETFRRALRLNPDSAWLIFEFARCLHSYAGLERNKKLMYRANAALRLAESRAGSDSNLLSRIGESYFQYGNWKRAYKTFYKTLSVTAENFRSVRGLAEIALREGKIAHVIHHFASAAHFAETNALRRWAKGENEYFARLNDDDNYMEAEVTRINWLESVENKKRSVLRFSLLGVFVILFGVLFNETVALFGWSASFISIMLWIGLIFSQGLLTERCPFIEYED